MEERCTDCLTRRGEHYPIYLTRRRSRRFKSPEQRRIRRFLRRVVTKSGRAAVHRKTVPQRSYRYLIDLANTLISTRWEWALLAVCLVFLSTWLLFACLWLLIASLNGDLDRENTTVQPCLTGIQGFAGYLLFSVETQTTIGYGNRSISHHCPEAVFLMCVQTVMGICICGGLVSIVYTKMSSPQKLNSMNSFSKHAVICQRDGQLCLMFRVRDCVNRYQCHNTVRAYLVESRGRETLLKSVHLESIGALIWPIEIVHAITETSPFWDLSAKDLIMKRFEIILTMEGESLSTACMSLTTASYLSKEVLWGHRFKNCVLFDKERQRYVVDHKRFNTTVQVDTPLCSAKRMNEIIEEISASIEVDTESLQHGVDVQPNDRLAMDDEDSGRYTLSPITVHRENLQESNQRSNDETDTLLKSPMFPVKTQILEHNKLKRKYFGSAIMSRISTLDNTVDECDKVERENPEDHSTLLPSLTRITTQKPDIINFKYPGSPVPDASFTVFEESHMTDTLLESLNKFIVKTNEETKFKPETLRKSNLLETSL